VAARTRLLAVGLAALSACAALSAAGTGAPPGDPVQTPPFILPFRGPPGPSTWLLIQPYGNTLFAYRERADVYHAGQGIHFGIDLAVRCGTIVVAIGDGKVVSVDNLYNGSAPHNLIIDHPNGYASLYGHLLERSPLQVGQVVHAGDVVGLSGDPDQTCTSRPHLHLEIRNAPGHSRAFNPLPLIRADWERIALAGGFAVGFEHDMQNPRGGQTMEDQPAIRFGSPRINDYATPWPPDW
jgi:murein DD-endopeptidase MepM/ murein hydrolase activator NlpD